MMNPTALYVCACVFAVFVLMLFIIISIRMMMDIIRGHPLNRSEHGPMENSIYDVEQPPASSYEEASLPTYYELCELGLPSYEEAMTTNNNNNFIDKIIDEILIVVVHPPSYQF